MSQRQDEGSIGYILHRRPYRENSLILDVLTRDHGRISVVARKRSGRKAASPIAYEVFRRLRLRWRGRGELKTLTGLEQASAVGLSRDRLLFGLYFNELLLRLLPRGEEEAAIFEHYEQALVQLGSGAAPWPVTTRFELSILLSLGYGLDPDPSHHQQEETATRNRPRVPTLSAASIAALEEGRLDSPQVLAELRDLLDALFYHYLGGRRIRARSLLPSPFKR